MAVGGGGHPLNTRLTQTHHASAALTQLGGADNELAVGVLSVMPQFDRAGGGVGVGVLGGAQDKSTT